MPESKKSLYQQAFNRRRILFYYTIKRVEKTAKEGGKKKMLSTEQLEKQYEKVYIYTDESKNSLYCKVREKGKKKFLQFTCVNSENGIDYWQHGLNNVTRLLYGEVDLVKAKALLKPVIVTEGEKDTDNLKAFLSEAGREEEYFVVTHGGTSEWKEEFAEKFKGVPATYLLPDNDDVGRKLINKIAEDICKYTTALIIDLPGLEEKEDVSNWMELGGSIEELEKLFNDAKPYKKKNKTCFMDYVLKPGDLDIPEEWLINGVIAPETTTVIYSKAGGGKSYFTLLTGGYLIEQGKIDTVIYMDNDNSRQALSKRKIEEIQEKFNGKFLYIPKFKIDKETFNFLEKELENKTFGKCFIVIDSIRNFLNGKDPNSDRDAISFMDTINKWRDLGNTVILLHHTRKDGEIKNNTSFIDYADTCYGLFTTKETEKKRLFFEFKNKKDRIGTLEEFSGFLNYDINSIEMAENLVNPEDYEFTNIVIEFLEEGEKKQKEIKEYLKESGYTTTDYNQRMIIKYTGVLWKYERGEKNAQIYTLLPDKLP
ncbi:MAG: AAA family ATPase, partial [Candidatus Margulisbacteria bacterium]|nr:AAA family ATPase [Candidatus Margulisiibacteriota bacterium]